MSKMINLIAEFELKEGAWDHISAVVHETVQESRKEKGNHGYTAYFPEEGQTRLIFIEYWESQEILDLHTQTDHFKKLMKTITPYTLKPLKLLKLTPIS